MADSMQFWGVEVKPNQTVKCEPGEEKLLHLSMAALGESKKAADNVVIYVTFDNQKLVIGTLSSEKCAQISYDLVFEKDFELSHSSKNATVYFTGFKSIVPTDDEVPSDSDFSESEEEETVGPDVLEAKSNDGKVERKSKVNALKANKAEQIPDDDDDSEDEDFEDDDGSHDGSSDEEKGSDDEDDEDDEDDDSEEEEETPKKAASKDKKRPAEPVTKALASEKKKAKLAATPADGKKGKLTVRLGLAVAFVAASVCNSEEVCAVPHIYVCVYTHREIGGGDAKKETPAKSEKKQQSPKSGGSVSCKSCSKTFNSEKGLESHTKAKHAAK